LELKSWQLSWKTGAGIKERSWVPRQLVCRFCYHFQQLLQGTAKI